MGDKQSEHKLARNPLGHALARIDLPSQFTRHFVETFDCIRYTADHFQTFTYGPINCDPGKCELHTTECQSDEGYQGRGSYSH